MGTDAWFQFLNEDPLSRPSVLPTPAEFRLLEILWVLEEGTIDDLLLGGLHPKTVQRMARRGALPHYRVGKYFRYRVSELDAWLRAQRNRRARITRLLNLERRSNEQTVSRGLSVPGDTQGWT